MSLSLMSSLSKYGIFYLGSGGGGSANNTRANGGNGGVYLIVPK